MFVVGILDRVTDNDYGTPKDYFSNITLKFIHHKDLSPFESKLNI